MTTTLSNVFERTLQKTHSWMNELERELGYPDPHVAYTALRATLHALRDRLTVEEVAHLGAQFPMLIRGLYYEGWSPAGKPVKERHREQFLARIEQEFKGAERIDACEAARAVFSVLSARVAEGEIEDVKQILPADIRDLWP